MLFVEWVRTYELDRRVN